MKKSSLIKKSTFPYWICSVFFAVIAFASISSAQITKNSIPEPIEKSKPSVGLEEVVKIPDSGSQEDKTARFNRLIPPGDGSGRLFVNDRRGKLKDDEAGELYVTKKQDEKVRKIVRSPESLNYQSQVNSEVSTGVGTITPTLYDGRTAFRLSDGRTEAVVVPEIGRVMRYGFLGGSNFLWNSPQKTYGENEWKNWGGDKTWPAPQLWWPVIAGRNWPPDPAWDGNAHTARVLPNNHLQMTSDVASGFGGRVVRDFGFERNGDFAIRQTVEKVKGEPLLLSIWNVTQIEPPDAIFLPLNPRSIYKDNFHWLMPPNEEPLIVNKTPTLLQIHPSVGVSVKNLYKVGVDSRVVAVAAVKDGIAMMEKATHQDGEYPDGAAGGGGFPVEVYNNGDSQKYYVELELLSPLHLLQKGSRYQHTVHWSLHRLPGSDVNVTGTRAVIEKLLQGK
jgi:hypothetical protein